MLLCMGYSVCLCGRVLSEQHRRLNWERFVLGQDENGVRVFGKTNVTRSHEMGLEAILSLLIYINSCPATGRVFLVPAVFKN